MGLSSPGIGSNLDVNSIVSQLMAVEAQPLNTIAKKEASYQAKISAFGSLSGALSSFQSALATLSSPAKFQSVSATSSDSAIVGGSATSKAVAGSYAVEVTRLAQAQTLSTRGQVNTTAPIGDGAKNTLTFQFGTISGGTLTDGVYGTNPATSFVQDADQPSGSVVLDSSNNSLQGIRDAVNKANLGVTATIVSDGSAAPNHLVFTSNKTGQTSSMKISVVRDPATPVVEPANPAAETALADLLGYNAAGTQNMTQSSAAQNTALTVNGIAITGATRSIKEAIQGVTLNVSKIGSTTMTVARDTAAITAGVTGFVKAYNDLDKTIKTLTAYNPATKVAGPLLGDSSVRNIQDQVRKTLGTAVTGNGGKLTTLSQVGVAFQKDGSVALDAGKLQKAITDNFDDLAGLFAAHGTSSDSLVSFMGSTTATKAGPNALTLTTLATRGAITGSAPPSALTIKAGVNDKLDMTVDGVAASVTLAAATYTQASLLAQVQSAVNGASAYSAAGIGVTVSTAPSGALIITSNRYGSASKVGVAGNGAPSLLGTQSLQTGVDVAGLFNGVKATGAGKILTGALGSASEGLRVEVDGGLTGDRGSIAFSQGYAALLSGVVSTFIGTGGAIAGKTTGLQSSIKSLSAARAALNDKLEGIEKRYRTQYSALDTMISKMNTTSSFLAQQLTQISNL